MKIDRQRDLLLLLRIVLIVLLPARALGQDHAAYASDEDEKPWLGVRQLLPEQMFLWREREGYVNYAFTGYQNYRTIAYPYVDPKRKYYTPLGDPLIEGFEVFQWFEQRRAQQAGRSYIYKDRRYKTIFDQLIVGSERTSGWSGKFIVGDEIRTKLTPLTMNIANLNGVRADLKSRNTALTVVLSRTSHPVWALGGGDSSAGGKGALTLLFGGHVEQKIGVLTVGGTVVNHWVFDRYKSTEENSWKGVLTPEQPLPAYIVVKVEDDSPEDGRGPVVFDAALWVNGVRRTDVLDFVVKQDPKNRKSGVGRVDRLTGAFDPRPYYDFKGGYLFDDPIYEELDFPLYADHLYFRDYLSALTTSTDKDDKEVLKNISVERITALLQLQPTKGPWRANRGQALYFYFDLSAESSVVSVDVEFTMGNDYRVEVAELEDRKPRRKIYYQRYFTSYFLTVARAPGNVQDLSNVQTLRIPVGVHTGVSLYGVHMHANFRGLEVRGEVVRNVTRFQYPDGPPGPLPFHVQFSPKRLGRRHTVDATAAYLTVRREGEWFGFAGEVFSISPDYNTALRTFHSDFESVGPGLKNNTGVWATVDDNDDDDRFPDRMYTNTVTGVNARGQDPDGVFPGKDEDGDGIPDNNRNSNELPDYFEPFLMYDVEPDEYDYGPDLNQNHVIDTREDDRKPDYPYDADMKGGHVYVTVRPIRELGLTAGWLDSHQPAGGGRSDVQYVRVDYKGRGGRTVDVQTQVEVKRVHDSIADDVYRYQERRNPAILGTFGFELQFGRDFVRDPLDYRNSWVSRGYVQARSVQPLRLLGQGRIRWYSSAKVEVNDQQAGVLEDGMYQRSDRVDLVALVGKMELLWKRGAFELRPAVKATYLREARKSLGRTLIEQGSWIPLVRATYWITPQTALRFGLQGYRVRDRANPREEFDQRNAVLMMTIRSEYFGYQVYSSTGLSYEKRTYLDPFRAEDNIRYYSAFVRVIIGFER